MNDQQRDRILKAIRATGATEHDEAFCDQTQESLAAYVELELSEGGADRTYPAIARHLAVCPDCHEEYEALRESMTAYSEAALPAATADLSRLPPPPLINSGPQESAGRPVWPQSLMRLSGVKRKKPVGAEMHAGGAFYEHAIRVPLLGAHVTLHLQPVLEAGSAVLSGYFEPLQQDLRGRVARLYAVSSQHLLEVAFQEETVMEEFGSISFAPLPLSDYVLTLELPDGEVPVVLLGIDIWQEV